MATTLTNEDNENVVRMINSCQISKIGVRLLISYSLLRISLAMECNVRVTPKKIIPRKIETILSSLQC